MEKTEHAGSPEGQLNAAPLKPRPLATTETQRAAGPAEAGKRPSFEFRGFDFFAKRDFNELKSASDAYFAPKAKRFSRALGPASWLRDPTPPGSPEPPETAEEAAAENAATGPSGGRNPTAARSNRRRSLCGLKKSRFWLLVGLLVLLILVVIGVGVGVGVSKQRSAAAAASAAASAAATDGTSSSSPPSASPDVPTSTPSATPTDDDNNNDASSSSSPTPTPSTNPAAGKLDCPAANGTTYQVPGSDKRFLRVCGVDHVGGGGAVELTHVPTQSMLDCMTNCAGTYGCVGAGWGYQAGDVGYEHQCWMKSKLGAPRDVALDWSFAVLL